MTELQEIEVGLLQQFLSICEKLNLTYYLVCGSALAQSSTVDSSHGMTTLMSHCREKITNAFAEKRLNFCRNGAFAKLSFRAAILSPWKQAARQQNDLYRDDGGKPKDQSRSIH